MFHSRDVGEQVEAEYVANGWKMEGGTCRVWADKETPNIADVEPRETDSKQAFKDLYDKIERDADEINAFVNYHKKCRPGSCSKGLKYNTCQFGVLMRSKLKSGVTQLTTHPDTGKVVVKPTSDNEKLAPVNEDWPLEPVDERTLVWELKRKEGDDQMQIETSHTATCAL